jgi:23S rRNA U2552 (ribose-2'-O)-methylase RlmE/FtsJ
MYKPVVFKVIPGKDDIFDHQNNVLKSPYQNMPLFSLGFHPYIHQTKDKMEIVEKLKKKRENFYYVVNPFEHKIANYEDTLYNSTKLYFNLKKDSPKILSRAFYKLWEILFIFNLVDINKKDITYAALAEGPGSFLQALMYYREKFSQSNSSKDKYFAVSIHSEEKYVVNVASQFIGYHEKKNPGRLYVHPTYNKDASYGSKTKDNGDLTDVKTISLFKKDIKKNKKWADIVSADGGFKWLDENMQEQEAYALLLGEIVAALSVQAKDGSFVLKLFESFTGLTLKMLYIVSSFYEESYISKPYTSRPSNSEKYLVCKGFKYDQSSKDLQNKIAKLEEVLEEFNTEQHVNDIFTSFDLPDYFLNIFRTISTSIANGQQVEINKMIDYINGNNYYGTKYHKYREDQINATQYWKDTFYPINNKIYTEKKDFIDKLVKEQLV